MPTWGEILAQLQRPENRLGSGPEPRPNFDKVRREYLAHLYALTGRPVILYASAFTEGKQAGPEGLQVHIRDVHGFMEAVHGIADRELDLILHSPGGSAEAAESIVEYLRTRFDHIRVFVPLAAMSAATMMALGADTIVMARHSQLGPIDPQFIITTPEGARGAPAKAILNQFDKAKKEIEENPAALAAWLPILRSYAPGLLSMCEDSRALAETMVRGWLQRYMFRGEPDAEHKANSAASWFADYENFSSHGRRVGIAEARGQGLHVEPLESDQSLQDAVLSVFHATSHTFTGTAAVKIIENHLGKAFVTMSETVAVPIASPRLPGTLAADDPASNSSRAVRRRDRFRRR
jgi:hypothetical protein